MYVSGVWVGSLKIIDPAGGMKQKQKIRWTWIMKGGFNLKEKSIHLKTFQQNAINLTN